MKITTKFVNNTATITHGQYPAGRYHRVSRPAGRHPAGRHPAQAEANLVHVCFQGHGTFEDYLETMHIAEGIAKVYQTPTLLLEKHDFEDLSVSDFKLFLATWLSRLDGQAPAPPQYRVALLVPPEVLMGLSNIFLEQNLLRYHQAAFNIFTSEAEASDFLRAVVGKHGYSLV